MATRSAELNGALVVFDDELSPAQVANLSELIPAGVRDRSGIILDIFAARARTSEGKLQVELARLNYILPRLTGRGAEMSRLGGGLFTRGPSESKLEVDRRLIRRRIVDLRRALTDVRRRREMLRDRRRQDGLPLISLVGHTNAGKSTLMNALTGAGVPARDKLFVTSLARAHGRVIAEDHRTDALALTVELDAAWARRIRKRLATNARGNDAS